MPYIQAHSYAIGIRGVEAAKLFEQLIKCLRPGNRCVLDRELDVYLS